MLPDNGFEVRPLRQGLINETYLLQKDGQTQYIFQRINTSVFPKVAALMGNLEKSLYYLSAEDYQNLELVKTRKGTLYLDAGEAGCWRLMNFIPGSRTYNTTTNPVVAREAGRIIARFHGLLAGAPLPEFQEVISRFHDLDFRLSELRQALGQAPAKRRNLAAKALGIIGELTQGPILPGAGNLPQRICHNDTKLNNILFSDKEQKALCLIDLDTLMKGYFLYDFGDAVRTIVNTAPEDERILEKIQFSRPLFEAFVEGIGTEPDLLSEVEIDTLARGAIYMPLLHGLRALTDYLLGDIYYQIAYEGQNLDRSMSLLTFAKRAQEELPYMQMVIRHQLG